MHTQASPAGQHPHRHQAGSPSDEGCTVTTTLTTRCCYRTTLQPLHAVLLAGTIPLFLGALLSDIAYWRSYQIQWSNFASWLIAGALVFGGFALLFALVNLIRAEYRRGCVLGYVLVLLATWVLGFLNALQHAKDAWAVMPAGLILSVIVTVLAIVATWLGFCSQQAGGEA
jgi:uncharacterized membrane protein